MTGCTAGGKAERIPPCLHPLELAAYSSLEECATLFRFRIISFEVLSYSQQLLAGRHSISVPESGRAVPCDDISSFWIEGYEFQKLDWSVSK